MRPHSGPPGNMGLNWCMLFVCTVISFNAANSCWTQPEQARACCDRANADTPGCWEDGHTFATCCDEATKFTQIQLFGILAFIIPFFILCRNVHKAGFKKSKNDVLRLRHYDTLQQQIHDTNCVRDEKAGCHGTPLSNMTKCHMASPSTGSCDATESPETFSGHACDTNAADAAQCSMSHSELLVLGDEVLLEVLGNFDGAALLIWEALCHDCHAGNNLSLPGVWRLTHVRSIGGNPPTKLARQPTSTGHSRCGPWREWFFWRQHMLSEPDSKRSDAALELLRVLLQREENPTAQSSLAEANLMPMKPAEHWLANVLRIFMSNAYAESPAVQDERIAPLSLRWNCHAFAAAEAIVADAIGFHTDHLQVFMCWSYCFSALQGQPRLYIGISQHSAANETWDVEIVSCKIPGVAKCSWTNISAEILQFLVARQDLLGTLCGASVIARLRFCRPPSGFVLQKCELAPPVCFSAIHKELFGWRDVKLGTGHTVCDRVAVARVLGWALPAMCPNPFTHQQDLIIATLEQVSSYMEELESRL